jgi:hypothetical protein
MMSMSGMNSLAPIVLIVFGVVLYVARLSWKKKEKNSPYYKVCINQGKAYIDKADIFALLNRIPLISNSLYTIKVGLYAITNLEETQLRQKSVEVFLKSVIASFSVLFLILIFIEKNPYNIFVSTLMAVILFRALVESYIRKNDIILEQLPEAINDLKHHFSSEKTIEKAYLCTIKASPYEISIHLSKILDLLKQPYERAKSSMKKYNDECHNKYLKLLNAYSFLTKEYGDVVKNGESMFNVNMNYLIAEIRNEYRKKKIINSALFGQKFFALLPLFALPALKQYLLKYMALPELKEYYNSSFGYLSFIACWCVTIFCYLLYGEISKTNEAERKILLARKPWEAGILKIAFVAKIIRKLMPRASSDKYQRIHKNMIRAANLQKIEWFYLKKILIAGATFLAILSIVVTAKYINIKHIYEDVTYGMNNRLLEMTEIDKDSEKREAIRNNDAIIIERIKQMKAEQEENPEKLKENIEIIINNLKLKGVEPKIDAQRIYNKVRALKKITVVNFDILAILVISWLSYFIPNINLALSSIVQSLNMQDEVMGFQTVILLLMHHERVTVEIILDWLIWFSDIFKLQLTETKNNLNDRVNGGMRALEKLKNDVKYKPMQYVVHNLMLAQSKLNLHEAFAGLEQDQRFNLQLRKDNTEVLIKTKVMLATRIVSFGAGFSLIIYLVVPLIYSAYSLLTSILKTAGI